MYAERSYYQVCGYYGDTVGYEFTHSVDGPCDAKMIEQVQDFHQKPEADAPQDYVSYVDLFYCAGKDVRLIGTWVTNQEMAVWHEGGWIDRPRASRESALRFLHERGRPA